MGTFDFAGSSPVPRDSAGSAPVPRFDESRRSHATGSPLRDPSSRKPPHPGKLQRLGGWLLLACAFGLCACSPEHPRPTNARNLLLITVDTLRADRLGAYGYDEPTSPAIDALAAHSVLFEQAQVQSAWTLPSLASLMTSLYTSTHGCWNFASRLDESFTTLAERLRGEGYTTAGVASHVFLDERYGLQQGFDSFDVELVKDFVASHEAITSEQVTAKGLAFLAARTDDERPWMLWVHYFDPHATYRVHPGLSERFGTSAEASRYDGEVAFTDRAIGELLSGLEAAGLGGETIVVLVADHGEEFGEHGGTGHGRTLHREILHVPLMLSVPGIEPRRVAEPVESVDLLPTLLELLGLEPAEHAAGRSLLPAMLGDALPERPRLAELALHTNDPIESFSADGWKLVYQRGSKRVMLFDLVSDPGELQDVAAAHPEVVGELQRRLEARTAEARELGERFEASGPLELTPEEIERLRALGYVDP